MVDITEKGYSLNNKENKDSARNAVGLNIGKVENFSDSIKLDKCYQFGFSSMGSIANVAGECSTNILDELGNILKNNATLKYITTNIDAVNNAIDSVKSFGRSTVGSVINSKLGLTIRGFYCGVLGPSMQILLMAIRSLISIPLTILNTLYKIIQKIKDISSSLTTKLFECFSSFLQGMQDNTGELNREFRFKINDLFSFLDDVENFLKNCQVISRPMIDLFNELVNYCSSNSMRVVFDNIGMTEKDADITFCSASEVLDFLAKRKTISVLDEEQVNELLNSFNPFNGLFNGAKKLNDLSRNYVQYGISSIYAKSIMQLHRFEELYNNFLRTRSRSLGILVNSSIGWLFPDCGDSKFEDGRIKRRRYSIIDVVNILDSMNTCNSYICGDIKNKVSELLAELELNRFGRWINPIVKANDNLTKYLNSIFVETFGSNSDILNNRMSSMNIDIEFIKKILPYSSSLKAVY